MGILILLAIPVAIMTFGALAGVLGAKVRERQLPLPALWPRKGPCFGEPIVQGGRHFGGRPGELYHRNLAGDREYMR
jgi:hypothetical protein